MVRAGVATSNEWPGVRTRWWNWNIPQYSAHWVCPRNKRRSANHCASTGHNAAERGRATPGILAKGRQAKESYSPTVEGQPLARGQPPSNDPVIAQFVSVPHRAARCKPPHPRSRAHAIAARRRFEASPEPSPRFGYSPPGGCWRPLPARFITAVHTTASRSAFKA